MKKSKISLKICILIIFCCSAFSLFSQNLSIGYDAAGNRIMLIAESNRNMTSGGKVIKIKPILKDEEKSKILSVSPNPSNDIVVLSSTVKHKEGEKFHLSVYDSQGNLLKESFETELPFTLDINMYAKGVYVLKLSNKNFSETVKVIKL